MYLGPNSLTTIKMAARGAAAGGSGEEKEHKREADAGNAPSPKRARVAARLCDKCASDSLHFGGVPVAAAGQVNLFPYALGLLMDEYYKVAETRWGAMPPGRQTPNSPYTPGPGQVSRDPLEQMRWFKKSVEIAAGLDQPELVITLVQLWVSSAMVCSLLRTFGTREYYQMDGFASVMIALKRAVVALKGVCVCEIPVYD